MQLPETYSFPSVFVRYCTLWNVEWKNCPLPSGRRLNIDTHTIASAKTHSLWPVFIRDQNKAASRCAAEVSVIAESISDVQKPQIPFLRGDLVERTEN